MELTPEIAISCRRSFRAQSADASRLHLDRGHLGSRARSDRLVGRLGCSARRVKNGGQGAALLERQERRRLFSLAPPVSRSAALVCSAFERAQDSVYCPG